MPLLGGPTTTVGSLMLCYRRLGGETSKAAAAGHCGSATKRTVLAGADCAAMQQHPDPLLYAAIAQGALSMCLRCSRTGRRALSALKEVVTQSPDEVAKEFEVGRLG